MKVNIASIEEYIESLPEDRRAAIQQLREVIIANLPEGFSEQISYGMIGYVVPHSIYPKGYHCNPKEALPFISIASQKNYIALYHMGIYAIPELIEWFINEYPKYSKRKLDMGKGCIRFKKLDEIPYELIAETVGKISAEKWIETYEKEFAKR